MKRLSEVDYWKHNDMSNSKECLRQKHRFLNFSGKTIWQNFDTRANWKWESRVSNQWNHLNKSGCYSKYENMRTRGSGIETLVIRYVLSKGMTIEQCCGIFFVQWSGQVHSSIIGSEEKVVVFFRQKYDYFILCNN